MVALGPRLRFDFPIIQAPMAGVSTPTLAAAVSGAGGLGSIATGTSLVGAVRQMMAEVRQLTSRPFNVNLFCHQPLPANPVRDGRWLDYLQPFFAEYGAEPPAALEEPFTSFLANNALLNLLLEARPPVISFHFGLPRPEQFAALRETGATLLACVTSLAEARVAEAAGVDALIAQGIEAGGHRGIFDPNHADEKMATLLLTSLLVQRCAVPVVAAGGITTGAGIAAAMRRGAVAAQLGTAFVTCPESTADDSYRACLLQRPSLPTAMTSVISGRPARALVNRFAQEVDQPGRPAVATYPAAYSASQALSNVARQHHQAAAFAAHWAGQGVGASRAFPAGKLVRVLMKELQADFGLRTLKAKNLL